MSDTASTSYVNGQRRASLVLDDADALCLAYSNDDEAMPWWDKLRAALGPTWFAEVARAEPAPSSVREGGAIVDARCSRCEHEGEYRTTCKCMNCGLEGVAIHSQGHTTDDSRSERCPRCGCGGAFSVLQFGRFVAPEEAPDAV